MPSRDFPPDVRSLCQGARLSRARAQGEIEGRHLTGLVGAYPEREAFTLDSR